jgi:hypothetical protein
LQLDNHYNTLNSSSLANNLSILKINSNHKITYVKDLYVNIPTEVTIKITKQQLLKNNDIHKTKQIITFLKTILVQNYFEFQEKIYYPYKGIAMGSPISGTMAELFLQYIESRQHKAIT